jgi:hypothetical protein
MSLSSWLLLPLVAVTACGGSSPQENTGPRGPRASDHIAIADRETQRGDDIAHWPDKRTGVETGPQFSAGAWFGSWDTESEHRRIAQIHRGEAARLEAAYEEACGDAPNATVSVSPLQRYGIGADSAPGGTMVLLSPDAGPPEKLLAAMRCHRAWMMLGRSAMDDCPLDLPGVHVAARGDAAGIELTITIDNAALIPELRRRAAHEVEAGEIHSHPARSQ